MPTTFRQLPKLLILLVVSLAVLVTGVTWHDNSPTIQAQRAGKKGKGAAAAATWDMPSELRYSREAKFGLTAPEPDVFPGYVATGYRTLSQAPVNTLHLRLEQVPWDRGEFAAGLSRLKALVSLEVDRAWGWNVERSDAIAGVANLRELSLNYVDDRDRAPSILEPLAKLKNLRRLEIGAGDWLIPSVIKLAQQLPHLEVFHLRHGGWTGGDQRVFQDLAGIGELKGVHTLSLTGGDFSAACFEQLASMANLRALWLNNSTLGGGSFPYVAKLARQLELLSLDYVRSTDPPTFDIEGEEVPDGEAHPPLRELQVVNFMPTRSMRTATIRSLGRFKSLETLRLRSTSDYFPPKSVPVTPERSLSAEALLHLDSLEGLRVLDISGHQVTAEVIAKLSEKLISLEELSLAGGQPGDLTPEVTAGLAKFPRLRSLDLSRNVLTTDHARKLAELTQLESIRLEYCVGIDDDFCKALASCKSLALVNVKGTSISADGVDQIAKLPDLLALNIADCEKCIIKKWPRTSKLQVLWLDNCGIRESGLPVRRTAPKLTALSMRGTFSRLTPEGHYTDRFDLMPGVTGKGLASVFTNTGLVYIDITGVEATTEQIRGVSALKSVVWMRLPVDGMVKGGSVVSNPLGPAKFPTLKRLHVETFAPSSYGDFNDPTMAALRNLETFLNQEYSHAEITTLHRPDPWE